ncbi:MAG: ABC transporter ATP-binding protein [Flavobacteriales bacterium]
MSSLQAIGLAVGYPGKPLVTDLEWHCEGGALVSLIGVNGSGKSSLLRCLAGSLSPMAGTVLVNGRDMARMEPLERARTVGFVMPGRAVSAPLNVRAMVALGRQPWTGFFGRLKDADEQAIDAALQATGASHLADRSLHTLSDGEYQLVTIARVIAQDTPIVLLDEPTAFLDLVNRIAIVRRLASLAKDLGRIILFSTHDLQVAVDHADRVLLLQGGRAYEGPPMEVLASDVIQNAFRSDGLRFDPATRSLRSER